MLATPFVCVGLCLGSFEGVVDVEHGEMITFWVCEECFHFICSFSVVGWSDEDLGDGEKCCEGEDFVGAVELR